MNKLLLLMLCIIGMPALPDAQNAFQNISFERALQKAKKEHKLIFLQFESDDCTQCNEVADRAFADVDFAKKISSEFVSLKIQPDSKDRIQVGERYDFIERFGTLFIDETGRLIYTMRSTSSTPGSYLKEIETAYKRQRDFRTIEEIEKSYFEKNHKNVSDFENLIQAKTDLDLSTDLLLTEYTNLVTKDSLNSKRVLQFLIRQAPVYRSKADLAMRGSNNFKEAWYDLPNAERIEINNRIFRKSIKMAAMSRDESLAKSIAAYSMGTTTSANGKQNIYEKNMMSFYSQTKDTAKYFAIAIPYYDRYIQSLTPEYLKRIDSAAKSKAFKNPEKIISKPMEDGKQLQIRTARYTSPNSTYGNYLFRVANFLSNFDASNKYIEHSIRYARKSVELSAQPNYLHFLAVLLYKNGMKEEAINYEEKAIALSKEYRRERKEWFPILEKMKAGMPLN